MILMQINACISKMSSNTEKSPAAIYDALHITLALSAQVTDRRESAGEGRGCVRFWYFYKFSAIFCFDSGADMQFEKKDYLLKASAILSGMVSSLLLITPSASSLSS